MKQKIYITVVIIFSIALFGESYIDDFTRISVDPMIEGSGGAYVGKSFLQINPNTSASNYNPANLGAERSIMLSHSSVFDNLYIADFIAYNDRLSNRVNWGVSGFITGGDGVMITALPDESDTISQDNRPYILEEKTHYDFLINPSASYSINDKTSAGITMKLFYRKLIDENAIGGSLSAGLNRKMGDDLNLGLFVRNLSTMPVSWSTGTTENALPSFRLGGVWRIVNSSKATIEAAFDGEYSIDDEYFGYGGGIRSQILDNFSLSAGYNDIGFSTSAAAVFNNIGVAASFSNQTDLENSYRVSLFYRWK